jgi:UDP-N-acetylmuramate--alanine ligase
MTHYHFIGIGGTGISPIAQILVEKGHIVSGSDIILSAMARELQNFGVRVIIGHDAQNITGADIVIRSSAIQDNNVEVIAAKNNRVPVLKRSDFLDELTKGKSVIAIAGTHGKTTTTSLMAWTLANLGEDPSYIIGGISKNLKTNAHAGKGKYFVIEADEYDGMFLGLHPELLIITNIEYDHPDYYTTPQIYLNAFEQLISLIKPGGTLLTCKDNPQSESLLNHLPTGVRGYSYGENSRADFIAADIRHIENFGINFSAHQANGYQIQDIQMQVSGKHNVLNALAVLSAVYLLGFPVETCRKAFESFIGAGRRFDILGTAGGVTVIDDYAHHPTEIVATLAAARGRFPGQILWTVWQPHTYSRTQTLLKDFIIAFKDSDHVIVTEIYRSREKEQNYSSAKLIQQIQHADAKFIGDFKSIITYLTQHLNSGDVLLVLSAGDADQISAKIFDHLLKNEVRHG